MLIFLAFLFLLTPFPSLQATIGDRKNSTKTAAHTITPLNVKQKAPILSAVSKTSNVSQTLVSTPMSPETPGVKKGSKDKPSSSSPIKVVITEGCIQKELQKDKVNSSKAQETELSLKPGSPLVMTHHISLVPGSCTGSCEAEMTALKARVENLEKEMSALKRKCTVCSGVQCPNNCNKNGVCIDGKCVCQAGFTGVDCDKGAIKENQMSSDSITVKQQTLSWDQSKANNTIINRKGKVERHQDQARGPETVEKNKLNNHTVTQSTEKKSTETLKVLIKLANGTKDSADKTTSEKGKLSLSNVTSTENEKKPSRSSIIKDPKGGASVIQKLEIHANATEEFKSRDKKQHKGHDKNVLEKHVNVTMSTEKNKKTVKESATVLKEESAEKKMVGKHLNVPASSEKEKKPSQESVTLLSTEKLVEKHSDVTSSIEIDKKPRQGNITQPKEGSSAKKLAEKHSKVTAFIETVKKPNQGNITQPKEGSSEKQLVEKHSDVTIEKDKKPRQGNITQPKEGSSAKTLVEKHSDVTSSIEKDKKPSQGNVTQYKEGSSSSSVTQYKEGSSEKQLVEKHSDITIEKDKKPRQGNITQPTKGLSAKKLEEKHSDVTSSIEKDKKLSQGNITQFKEESSAKILVVKHSNVTSYIKKEKKTTQGNITQHTVGSSAKKLVEKHSNVTAFIEKVKKPSQGNITQPKEGSSAKKLEEKHSDVTSSIEKDKKLSQGNITQFKEESSANKLVEKHPDVTSFIGKVKKTSQGNITQHTEGSSAKTLVEKHSNVIAFIEKEKKPGQGSITQPKEGSSAKTLVVKHSNVTSFIKTEKKPIQGNVTQHAERSSAKTLVEKHYNVTSFIKKEKKTTQGNITQHTEGSSAKKLVEKHYNVTAFIEKVKKPSQGNVTQPKEGSSAKKLEEKHSDITFSIAKEKKPGQGNITQPKEGSSAKTLVEKHSNNTSFIKKEKKPIQGNITQHTEGSTVKKLVEKHSDVTSSIEKDKKPSQGIITKPKEKSSTNKLVEKTFSVTTTSETDRKLRQSNDLPKDGSPGKKKADKLFDVTAGNNKDKTFLDDDETTANKKATSGNKKVEAHVNVTAATEKDTKLNQGNVMRIKESLLGKKTKVDKYVNVSNSTEKDIKSQISVIPHTEKTSGMRNITTSSQKRKKLVSGKVTLGIKTAQKQVNINTSTEIDSKVHQGNVTLLKDGSSRKTKQDSHLSVTTSIEKDKKLLQSNKTEVLTVDVTAEKKRVNKHLNMTTFTEKDKKFNKSNTTLIKEDSSHKRNVDKVNKKNTSEKGKTFLQGDTTTFAISVTEEKDGNTTSISEKESLHHSLKEDVSRKNITIFKTHADRTTKLIDIGPVEVHNITATGFVITWKAPQGLFRNFTVTRREVWSGTSSENDAEQAEKSQGTDELYSLNRTSSSAEKFSQVVAGSVRSYHFKNLRPQRKYSVSVFSSGSHVRSKVHRLFVSTGPEPPTELLFSNITETSLTVSWTKPKSTVTGFRVTYTNSANGATGSMSVDSQLSHVLISMLSVGSRYEISVRSVTGAIESEATTALVVTVPDSPTDLQAVNVTDSKAVLVWKPAQAKVDHYILSYGSTRSPNVTVTVMLSGTSVKHKLTGLQRSTLYAVKLISQINSLQSRSLSTTFTTKSGIKLQEVTPSEVTWNSAVISWKTTHLTFKSYRLTYQHGEEVKEVILNPTVYQYKLTDLKTSSHYTVKVDGESEGQYISVVSTTFTTAQVPYPYPAECSQMQQNGMKNSGEAEIYPEGKDGEAVWVYCDMETDGGGWTVFQRRVDGSTDFFREWKDYSKGFGEMSSEFWLGNDVLHALTNMEPMSLRIDLRLGNDTAYAYYSNFSVGSEVNHYTIEVSGYSGTAGDSMKYHNGSPFSAKDKGPSTNSVHCANNYMGGWWYKNCYKANLNGVYATFSKDQGVVWIDWKGKDISLPFTEMKLRPASLSLMTMNTQG